VFEGICCFLLQGIYGNVVARGSVMVKAARRKVAGSRSDEVKKFVGLPNPSGRTSPWGLLSL
jgi:hypothetical protein